MKFKRRRRVVVKGKDHPKGWTRRRALTAKRIMVNRRGNNLFKSDDNLFGIFVEEMDLAHIKD